MSRRIFAGTLPVALSLVGSACGSDEPSAGGQGTSGITTGPSVPGVGPVGAPSSGGSVTGATSAMGTPGATGTTLPPGGVMGSTGATGATGGGTGATPPPTSPSPPPSASESTAGAAGSAGGAGGSMGEGLSGSGGAGGAIMSAGGSAGSSSGGNGGTADVEQFGEAFLLVAELIQARCADVCHGGQSGQEHLVNLSTSDLSAFYATLTSPLDTDLCYNQTPVTAGAPEESLLLRVVQAPLEEPCVLPQMPAGCGDSNPCLDETELSILESWIAAGALPD